MPRNSSNSWGSKGREMTPKITAATVEVSLDTFLAGVFEANPLLDPYDFSSEKGVFRFFYFPFRNAPRFVPFSAFLKKGGRKPSWNTYLRAFFYDDFRCVHCGCRCNRVILSYKRNSDDFLCVSPSFWAFDSQLTVDHIAPISRGRGSNFGNLQILCYPCNQSKGNDIYFGS
jgi:5-methylcytosine-specific restriction enzyme A